MLLIKFDDYISGPRMSIGDLPIGETHHRLMDEVPRGAKGLRPPWRLPRAVPGCDAARDDSPPPRRYGVRLTSIARRTDGGEGYHPVTHRSPVLPWAAAMVAEVLSRHAALHP